MSFLDELDKIRRRFSQIDAMRVRDAWDDFYSGRPIEDPRFLIELDWQNNVREELRNILRRHNKLAPTKIIFLVGEPGGSKSQILSEIRRSLEGNLGVFLVYHTCYDYRTPEYLNSSIVERRNKVYPQLSVDKRRTLDMLDGRIEIPALMNNLRILSQEFEGGVVILIDEIDYVNDSELAEWVNFFVSVNDRLRRGLLVVVAIMRKKLEKVLADTRVYRFVDDVTGKGIIEIFGRYRSNDVIKAFAHFVALYERAFGTRFDRDSLRFLKRVADHMSRSLSEGATIRRANSIIMSIIDTVARIQEIDSKLFSNIYNVLSQITSGVITTRMGNDCETGLKLFLETTSFKINVNGETRDVRFSYERIHIPTSWGDTYVSDGSFVILESAEEEQIEIIRIPVEIKFVGRNERIPEDGVRKILEAERKRGIIVFVLGFYNEHQIRQQLHDLIANQIILIPNEIALLLGQLAIETREQLRKTITRLLRLVLNIERYLRPYLASQYEYIKIKPMIQKILSEVMPAPTQIQIRPQQIPIQTHQITRQTAPEQTTIRPEQAIHPKVLALARIIKNTLSGGKRRIGTIIKLMTTDLGIPKETAITVLKNLVGRGIIKRPRGWKETQFLSPIDRQITEEIIAKAIAESGIIQ